MNLMPVEVVASDGAAFTVQSQDIKPLAFTAPTHRAKAGDELVLGIRPHHLTIADDSGAIVGLIEIVEHLGNETVLNVLLPSGGAVIVSLPGTSGVKVGDKLKMSPVSEEARLFMASGPAVKTAFQALPN
jgi:multiple sugar transport system ATP-binding protein